MQARLVIGILVMAMVVSGIILLRHAGRGPDVEAIPAPPPRRPTPGMTFSERAFPFSTKRQDGGEGGAIGWQEASATLTFSEVGDKARAPWTCNVVVGMPLRTEKWGDITPDYAAFAASSTATDSATSVQQKGGASPSEFCKLWRDEMQALLNGIEGLGAKVSGTE